MKKLLLLMLLMPMMMSAQKLSIEKTYDISRKAKRGYLGNASFSDATRQFVLTYVTKANERKVKFENYYFDYDFNFLKEEADEMDFDKARTKYKWFRYKGENYVVEGLGVEPNLTGTLVLRKRRITYKWDWFFGGYRKKVEVLEKLKPKDEDGNKYFYITHAEDDVNGLATILASTKPPMKKGNDFTLMTREYNVLTFNQNLDLVTSSKKLFDFPQTMVDYIVEKFDEEEAETAQREVNQLLVLFAPAGANKKMKEASPTKYTLLRGRQDLNQISTVSIPSNVGVWAVNGWELTGNDLFIWGPSAEGTDKYYDQSSIGAMRGYNREVAIENAKWKAFQICHLSGDKVVYTTTTNLDDFEAKLKAPPSQKRSPAYKGKKFDQTTNLILKGGEFFLAGQNYKVDDDGVRTMKDVILFQFDNMGHLTAQYGVRKEENNKWAKMLGAPQYLFSNPAGSHVYWVLGEIDDVLEGDDSYRILSYPSVSKIDVPTASISDFDQYGDKKFYLDPTFPLLPISNGNNLAFFQANKSGKTLWFGRLELN